MEYQHTYYISTISSTESLTVSTIPVLVWPCKVGWCAGMLLCTTARVTMPHLPSQHCTPHHPCSHQPTFRTLTFLCKYFDEYHAKNLRVMQSDINSPTQDDYVFCGHAWNEFEFCLAVPLLLCPSNLKCLLSRVFKTHLHKTGGG